MISYCRRSVVRSCRLTKRKKIKAAALINVADNICSLRDLPVATTADHGTGFTSKALDEWSYFQGVKLDSIRLGKPTENGTIESFNGQLRDECLSVNEFGTLDELRAVLKAWKHDYNHYRPHGLLGNLTPSEYGSKRSGNDPEAPTSSFK